MTNSAMILEFPKNARATFIENCDGQPGMFRTGDPEVISLVQSLPTLQVEYNRVAHELKSEFPDANFVRETAIDPETGSRTVVIRICSDRPDYEVFSQFMDALDQGRIQEYDHRMITVVAS